MADLIEFALASQYYAEANSKLEAPKQSCQFDSEQADWVPWASPNNRQMIQPKPII
jgi:hypothetical protein